MDFQLIIDAGQVFDYMTKYVTKGEMTETMKCSHLMKRTFTKTMTDEGRSVQSFLRRTVSKLFGERAISRQESCHLMLSIPIVHCSHKLVNIDLRNENCKLNLQKSAESSTNFSSTKEDDLVIMSMIDAYACRLDKTKWKHSKELYC